MYKCDPSEQCAYWESKQLISGVDEAFRCSSVTLYNKIITEICNMPYEKQIWDLCVPPIYFSFINQNCVEENELDFLHVHNI